MGGKGNEPWIDIPSIVSISTHSCYGNHDKFRECGHQTCMKDLRVVTF